MCIYSPMPHTLSYCGLIGKCALIRSNMVFQFIFKTTGKMVISCNEQSLYMYIYSNILRSISIMLDYL